MEIKLPEQVKELLDMSIFDMDNQVSPEYLKKYLFYMPEVVRIFGLAAADERRKKRELERDLTAVRSEILMELASGLDSHKYKNEQMREAYVCSRQDYADVKREIDEIQYTIEQLEEELWKYKNLTRSLDNISRLVISERSY